MIQTADLAERTDLIRLDASRKLDEARRSELGQYLTPAPVGRVMASLLKLSGQEIRILEPGAGIGSLLSALVTEVCRRDDRPAKISVTAYEIDSTLAEYLAQTLAFCKERCESAGIDFHAEIRREDFLASAVEVFGAGLFATSKPQYDCVIMNPPYGKIRSDSAERRRLQQIGIETSNLYTGFLAAAVLFLANGGEMVAITPRSFCNGPYFRTFRRFFLDRVSFRKIHLFGSRTAAFQDDKVLQENIIFHVERSSVRNGVSISTSPDPDDAKSTSRTVEHNRLIWPRDPQAFIHIVPDVADQHITDAVAHLQGSLADLGLKVSTGRVVDFRAKQFLRDEPETNTAPLIYATHFDNGRISWPRLGRQPNAIVLEKRTENQLVPNGNYVLVKRFTAKEQPRRIIAAIHASEDMSADRIGFENHLNYFHHNGSGLDRLLAKGLAAFLNSTLIDMFFRQFSGHTQVNATDLRSFRYPTRSQLESLGSIVGDGLLDQSSLDHLIDRVLLDNIDGGPSPVSAKKRIREALEVLEAVDVPQQQQNERSALTLLALLGLHPKTKWAEADDPLIGIHDMLGFFAENYKVTYAENTRETIRRHTVHQFIHAGIVTKNPDDPPRPTTSPQTVYQIDPRILALVRTFNSEAWETNLNHYLEDAVTLRQRYAKSRELELVPLEVRPGELIELTPGKHNALIKSVVTEFAERFTPGGKALYVGDTGKKFAFYDEESLKSIGIDLDPHGQIPDVVLHHVEASWLVLVEAVTSHGPVNPKRQVELAQLFANSTLGLVYVTAFPDRSTLAEYLPDLSWETEVWVAETPDHLIHFDGERFLGPYSEES